VVVSLDALFILHEDRATRASTIFDLCSATPPPFAHPRQVAHVTISLDSIRLFANHDLQREAIVSRLHSTASITPMVGGWRGILDQTRNCEILPNKIHESRNHYPTQIIMIFDTL
jgi:hypothetical protein